MHYDTSVETHEVIAQFDDFLCNINYPHSIHRRVRYFRSYNDWKAVQLRLFLILERCSHFMIQKVLWGSSGTYM